MWLILDEREERKLKDKEPDEAEELVDVLYYFFSSSYNASHATLIEFIAGVLHTHFMTSSFTCTVEELRVD